MGHTKYVVQHTKPLSVQFTVPGDVQYLDGTISNNDVPILSQIICVYETGE